VVGGVLDQIKFTRISMLTDPALDAGRHEFELRTLLGTRVDPSCAGDIPPHDRLHVLRRPFSHYVGRVANGRCLSQ
jgi:hypothetical protein